MLCGQNWFGSHGYKLNFGEPFVPESGRVYEKSVRAGRWVSPKPNDINAEQENTNSAI
jgi:hypothetical protein